MTTKRTFRETRKILGQMLFYSGVSTRRAGQLFLKPPRWAYYRLRIAEKHKRVYREGRVWHLTAIGLDTAMLGVLFPGEPQA